MVFETDNVCFGKNGLTDYPYNDKFATPKGSFALGTDVSNNKIPFEVSQNSEFFVVGKDNVLEDNSGNIKISNTDMSNLVERLNNSRVIYIVIY